VNGLNEVTSLLFKDLCWLYIVF